jgi:predicted transcriptional regulator
MSYAMSTMTIRIPDPLRRQLQALSKRKQLPLSDLVRDSLRRYVAVEQFKALRSKSLPFAEAQGYLTDEDVFKAVS